MAERGKDANDRDTRWTAGSPSDSKCHRERRNTCWAQEAPSGSPMAPTDGATNVTLHFLEATLKQEEEIGEVSFSNTSYLTQQIQNVIISSCDPQENCS